MKRLRMILLTVFLLLAVGGLIFILLSKSTDPTTKPPSTAPFSANSETFFTDHTVLTVDGTPETTGATGDSTGQTVPGGTTATFPQLPDEPSNTDVPTNSVAHSSVVTMPLPSDTVGTASRLTETGEEGSKATVSTIHSADPTEPNAVTHSSTESTAPTTPISPTAPPVPTEPTAPTESTVHLHTSVIDPAVEATCQHVGLTEGSHCAVCGKVLVAQKEIPIRDHVFIQGVCCWCGKTGGGLELPEDPLF